MEVSGTNLLWVCETLPSILRVVKDEYRNPVAHSTTATYAFASKFMDYVNETHFFHHMNLLSGGVADVGTDTPC